MKYYLYIIYSAKLNSYYIGLTIDLENRLFKHRHSGVKFFRNIRDWKLVYTEDFIHRRTAKRKCIQFKKMNENNNIPLFLQTKMI
ncbi:MAG: excinuclease ABC subunit C [Bacteroidetes bacterium B1(2017)]|nr:MAG: excinuclease ABC subunit C [Bacteroidetes bacterium B1(2017)]